MSVGPNYCIARNIGEDLILAIGDFLINRQIKFPPKLRFNPLATTLVLWRWADLQISSYKEQFAKYIYANISGYTVIYTPLILNEIYWFPNHYVLLVNQLV